MMAYVRMIALALALASTSGWSPHPSGSARNQYEAREDKLQPQMLTEATDRHPPGADRTRQEAPDLQVGCGDGFIQEKIQEDSEVDKNKGQKKKGALLKLRRKRSYTPWSGRVVYSEPYQSIAVWRPPVYQLSRPYVIPIYGVPGRIPIYYPPQPLYVNPGRPQDNPFQGPSYLPPDKPTTGKPTMELDNRFNGGDDGDDRPVWDKVEDNQRVTTSRPRPSVVPTRRPRPPTMEDPPLVHNPTDSGGSFGVSNVAEADNNRLPTSRPPVVTSSRPATTQRPVTSGRNEPSRCVWAIISCCSTTEISYECFEQRNCPGAFWDDNPCDSEFARAAITAALNYYNNK